VKRRRLAATVAALAIAACVPAAAAAGTGARVTVAVYGDSIVEGYTIPGYLQHGLVPALGTAVAKAGGFAVGGTGLIPVTPFRMKFNRYAVFGGSVPNPNGWVLAGYASIGLDGLSGYSALTSSPQATATAPVDAPTVAVLFTKFAGSGLFTVTAGGSTWTIDGRSTGPPTPTEVWLTLPVGARSVTVHGPSTGTLIFDGLLDRKPVAPGRIQIEMENLGHMGHSLTDDTEPRIGQALSAQRFDVSIFLGEYIYQYSAQYGSHNAAPRAEAAYVKALEAYARRVRAYGGLCLIADGSPVPISAAVLSRFAAINQREARTLGCAHTGVLRDLWNPATSVHDGFTLIDGSHPTRLGYQRIVDALAPTVVGLVRARVRARS
jgi:lysophospholipase L1-like esterase